jgi:hypothetical protein
MFRWKTPLGAENAVKHGRHNQKLHGRRGGSAAGSVDVLASGPVDAWATGRYKPSERAKAITAAIAAEEPGDLDYLKMLPRFAVRSLIELTE